MSMKVITDKQMVEEVLSRGTQEVIERAHLRERMLSGERLRIKFGIDPTSPHLHLGHTVPLRKLRQFQDLGHQAVLIIGDATAMIGDPTGRSETRKHLTKTEIDKNKKTYIKQAGKVIDIKKTEVRHNGEWFHKMSAADFLGLTSLVTVQQVMQREDFRKRVDDPEHPLSAIELTYPVMQGYDSVMVKADVEIGGADQLLNLHMGRRIQGKFGMLEQDLLTVPLIEGTDGERKMSKSFGNTIEIEDEPEDMYGKLMSIPDSLIVKYFVMLTSVPLSEIEDLKTQMARGINPRDVKARLAGEIVRAFHGEGAAAKAAARFDQTFRVHEIPKDTPVLATTAAKVNVIDALVEAKLAPSRGEARRLIDGGGIKVDGHVIEGYDVELFPTEQGVLIQKGKRFFVRVVKK